MSDDKIQIFPVNEETTESSEKRFSSFIQDIIDDDAKSGKHGNRVHTRFPPEPNGYLHIGHAKSICLNFGIALRNNGLCNLRFDDTNPVKEDTEYVDSIMEDVKWLGFDWEDRLFYASDYFQKLYDCAEQLILKGHAYVCDLSADETREYRGTLTEPGKNSPFRDRSIEENLDLFKRMKSGEFADGTRVLRAKIDMSSSNMNMRDPVIYRILKADHHRTGDAWCIYPMYDYAHPISDYLEGITHSICTLEFEDHRPLYDWVLQALDYKPLDCPQQIEFARLNLNYTVMSKRKLLQLVKENYVNGWDDPRMPTISGLRRRGYTPSAIRDFAERIGVAKTSSTVDMGLLEHCIREDLNSSVTRAMAVLRPIKVIIDNYPKDHVEWFEVENNPEDPNSGTRQVPFSREIFIESDDFMENPAKKYFRLFPGGEVRLKSTYFVKCVEVLKDEVTGEIKEIHCTYDPATRGGNSPDGRKVKGTIHWVSATHAKEVEVRLYESLFSIHNPGEDRDGKSWLSDMNPNSLEVLPHAMVEPAIEKVNIGDKFQFMRVGYFCVDKDSNKDKLVFNRVVSLKDSWAKVSKG